VGTIDQAVPFHRRARVLRGAPFTPDEELAFQRSIRVRGAARLVSYQLPTAHAAEADSATLP
jgi:hypothetical protein